MLQLVPSLGCMPPARQRDGSVQKTGAGNYVHSIHWKLHECPILDVQCDDEVLLVVEYLCVCVWGQALAYSCIFLSLALAFIFPHGASLLVLTCI